MINPKAAERALMPGVSIFLKGEGILSKLAPGGSQLNFSMNNAWTNGGLDVFALILAQLLAVGWTILFP